MQSLIGFFETEMAGECVELFGRSKDLILFVNALLVFNRFSLLTEKILRDQHNK